MSSIRIMGRSGRIAGSAAVIGLGVWCGPVSAAVVAVDGRVSATVQELIEGGPASISSESESLGVEGAAFPLVASGGLSSSDLEGLLLSAGRAIGALEDPTRGIGANPAEFGLEAGCFSNRELVSYTVSSAGEETRTVVFGSLPGPGGAQEVESRVFFSGAIVMWSAGDGVDLDGVSGALRVVVEASNRTEPVFTGSVSVTGSSAETAATSGPVRSERVEVAELPRGGLDSETVAILEEAAERGGLFVHVIPEQQHAYRYEAGADEEITLTARFEAEVRNVPGGTGVAVTWGRPFENLAELIGQSLVGTDGAGVQRAVNLAAAQRSGGGDFASGGGAVARKAACGAFGMVGWLVMAAACVLLRWTEIGRSR